MATTYSTDVNFKYILFGDGIEIPTHTYKVHNPVITIGKQMHVGPKGPPAPVKGVYWKRPIVRVLTLRLLDLFLPTHPMGGGGGDQTHAFKKITELCS